MRNGMAATDANKMARLVKVTTTLGIHTCFTFLFNMIPDLLILYWKVSDQTPFYMMLNLNAMVNIFIYTLRFKELRKGLKAFFTCQEKVGVTPVFTYTNSVHQSQRKHTRSILISNNK
uniref:G-protein coupled receptors family 1 profile domain-containing protein n=1 Tax=Plectus sambesii TaxID=2011161 RepID=A0A914VLS4_9BILA